ncbi:aspartate carbamoyltransferase regulatory subunit [Gemmiger formicilis]|uniref:aspartate carbamoyltransferase regulatory subunit n=1 Tax=Gemmiger formicilis TaxID=745368 RepID=UPI00399A051A
MPAWLFCRTSAAKRTEKKDIIKIEGDVSEMSFDVLAYVDPKISITFIRDGRVTEKKHPRAAQAAGQRHQMHEPALHHFH